MNECMNKWINKWYNDVWINKYDMNDMDVCVCECVWYDIGCEYMNDMIYI